MTSMNYETIYNELKSLVGHVDFPLEVTINRDGTVDVVYETSWKEGTTTPADTGQKDEYGNPIFDYVENYTDRQLTHGQVAKIEAYIASLKNGGHE